MIEHDGLPVDVIGDQRKIRQAISNLTANAIQNTSEGAVKVEMYVASEIDSHVEIEVTVSDTGVGFSAKRLDILFRELEQVQSEGEILGNVTVSEEKRIENGPENEENKRTLGLGLAVVARIIKNMGGQLRLKSEEGKGSRFVLQFPFALPAADSQDSRPRTLPRASSTASSETATGDGRQMVTPPDQTGEVTLIDRGSARRHSTELNTSLSRKNSTESFNSKRSLRSMVSNQSQSSQRSEADRLIDAISDNHMTPPSTASDRKHNRGSTGSRPQLTQRHSTSAAVSNGRPQHERAKSVEAVPVPEHHRELYVGPPGQANVPQQRTPIRPLRVPDGFEGYSPTLQDQRVLGSEVDLGEQGTSETRDGSPTADNMHVLVAEDDPVNSRIIQKRLEKVGHQVQLTVNGEECSSMYGEKSGHFDVVLMDMQVSRNMSDDECIKT